MLLMRLAALLSVVVGVEANAPETEIVQSGVPVGLDIPMCSILMACVEVW